MADEGQDSTPAETGQRWAKDQAKKGCVVGGSADLPDPAAVAYLQTRGILHRVLGGAAWVLRNPERHGEESAVLGAYWALIDELLQVYAPAAIDRTSAVRLWLGDVTPPNTLYVRQGKNATERVYRLPGNLEVRVLATPKGITPGAIGLVTRSRQDQVRVGELEVPVTKPAWVLMAMTLDELHEEMPRVASWIKHLTVPTNQIDEVYRAVSRPYVAARMARIAEGAGNVNLAERLEAAIQAHSIKPLNRARVTIPETPMPESVRRAPARQAPWRTRFEDQLARGLEQILVLNPPMSPRLTREELRRFASEAKREDVYHSTTIEGYRVTPEDLDALFSGVSSDGTTREEVERRMALRGYANAFDRILDLIPATAGPWEWTTDRILDCYVDLWTPSVDAGIVEAHELRAFRPRPAYLQGSRYVPPPPEKVWDLLEGLRKFLHTTDMPGAARAALGHWGLETVHPFPDGNGRVGRLLMNASLAAEGYPWLTIRAEGRGRYFAALEKGQIDDDLTDWGAFFGEQLRRAVQEADKIRTSVGPSRARE
ncbi:MAG: Fic family protein [Gemmatimonadales bacterium]|nr:Fic family protein [Gemmatimonadales bacterium]